MLSGATLQKRFSQAGSVNSTFFEDNYVSALLNTQPGKVTEALAAYLNLTPRELEARLSQRAALHLSRAKRQPRRVLFAAFQQAAISMLMKHPGPLRNQARVVHEERYAGGDLSEKPGDSSAPAADAWLEVATLWTALRERPGLRAVLWPASSGADFREEFRERELRRELLSAMARLGHPFIDLYVLSVSRLDRLELGAREQDEIGGGDLITDFLDLLERQQREGEGHTSFMELSAAAQHFDLILAVNEPKVRDEPLASAATLFGRLLRAQQPVGGMSGQVNETLVRQFRMPGYPLVLVTTDLLQEGEDLHTFCSSVHHYGISWMPSSMEQRVGRVDRVSSSTDRRLSNAVVPPDGRDLLQVYYPHLQDTVEVLQVRRVLERLNRFMRLMHEDIGAGEAEERRVDVSRELLRTNRDLEQIREPLKTAFPIRDEVLLAASRPLAMDAVANMRLHSRFLHLHGQQLGDHQITWDSTPSDSALYGTFNLRTRQQPFTLLLRSVEGRAVVRCVSPVGMVDQDDVPERITRAAARGSGVRVGAVMNQDLNSYNLTIEGDVLLGPEDTDSARIGWLLKRVTRLADSLELTLLGTDQPMTVFQSDITTEATYER